MSLAPAPPHPSKAQRTHRSLLEAAERRLAAIGFEKTRIDDGAEDVGLVGSANLYPFKDKRELFHEVREAVREASTSDAPMGERLEVLERDVVAMTSRLLGTDRPRARRRPAARTRPRKETP